MESKAAFARHAAPSNRSLHAQSRSTSPSTCTTRHLKPWFSVLVVQRGRWKSEFPTRSSASLPLPMLLKLLKLTCKEAPSRFKLKYLSSFFFLSFNLSIFKSLFKPSSFRGSFFLSVLAIQMFQILNSSKFKPEQL